MTFVVIDDPAVVPIAEELAAVRARLALWLGEHRAALSVVRGAWRPEDLAVPEWAPRRMSCRPTSVHSPAPVPAPSTRTRIDLAGRRWSP